VYSLGCTLYNLIKLKPPFSGKDENKINNNIRSGRYERIGRGLQYSDALIDLVERMMGVVWNDYFINLYDYNLCFMF
jgi:serine/threonine protein kinase